MLTAIKNLIGNLSCFIWSFYLQSQTKMKIFKVEIVLHSLIEFNFRLQRSLLSISSVKIHKMISISFHFPIDIYQKHSSRLLPPPCVTSFINVPNKLSEWNGTVWFESGLWHRHMNSVLFKLNDDNRHPILILIYIFNQIWLFQLKIDHFWLI